ncbi:hypothetical protein [Marinobacter sp.]|uniref:hypothetical protein n=1 Tax=Marinobacter sp. TaxID=50741 RepID=UPI003A90B5BC
MLIAAITFVIGLAGALLLAFGSWLVFPPAGFIVGGVLCLIWSFMSARAIAANRYEQSRQPRGDS